MIILSGENSSEEREYSHPQWNNEGWDQEQIFGTVSHCVASCHLGPQQWVQRDHHGQELRAFHTSLILH